LITTKVKFLGYGFHGQQPLMRKMPAALVATETSKLGAWVGVHPRAGGMGDGEPKIGAHGKPVLFLHPKDFCGTLVEIEQI
jgi:hypothetical protein